MVVRCKMRRWKDVKMWRWKEPTMWRCEGEKMWRCEDDWRCVKQTPGIRKIPCLMLSGTILREMCNFCPHEGAMIPCSNLWFLWNHFKLGSLQVKFRQPFQRTFYPVFLPGSGIISSNVGPWKRNARLWEGKRTWTENIRHHHHHHHDLCPWSP